MQSFMKEVILSRWPRLVILPLIALALAACPASEGTGPLETPVLVRIEEPQGNGWAPVTLVGLTRPDAQVMPVRAVRLVFTGPLGTYEPSVQSLDGQVVVPIPSGRNAAAADGSYYEMAGVDANTSPPTHTMFIRLPSDLPDTLNFTLRLQNRSLNSNRTSSDFLVVQVSRRPIYTVSVTVTGNGRVTSNPPGIVCGTSLSGQPLTTCSFDFGQSGVVELLPGSDGNLTFRGWGGACPANTQVCTLRLNGLPVSALANFSTGTLPPISPCPVPEAVPGWRYVTNPGCSAQPIGQTPRCDSLGWSCCYGKTGGSSPRCGGADKAEARPTCLASNLLLIQPWGCYDSTN